MGKASSSKKVARAAGTGGGRTNRGKAPVLWYSTLAVVLIAGIGLTAFSRQQRQDALGSPTSKVAPKANVDHWHVAYGVWVCGSWLDPVQKQDDPKGVHTHGDGIIHVHPYVAASAGKNATFARFTEAVGASVSATSFTWYPGDGKKKEHHANGQKCGDKPAEVEAFYDGKLVKGNPGDIRFKEDKAKLVLAFAPKGTTYEAIGDPPSTPGLEQLSDVAPTTQQGASGVPGTPGQPDAPATTAPGGATASTTAGSTPASTTATSAPASTTASSTPASSTP
jgi:hypothetical protein